MTFSVATHRRAGTVRVAPIGEIDLSITVLPEQHSPTRWPPAPRRHRRPVSHHRASTAVQHHIAGLVVTRAIIEADHTGPGATFKITLPVKRHV